MLWALFAGALWLCGREGSRACIFALVWEISPAPERHEAGDAGRSGFWASVPFPWKIEKESHSVLRERKENSISIKMNPAFASFRGLASINPGFHSKPGPNARLKSSSRVRFSGQICVWVEQGHGKLKGADALPTRTPSL